MSYFGIEDMSKSLYDVADHFGDAELKRRAQELVREEVGAILPELRKYRQALAGRRAAVYTGGAFKAFSLVRSLRTLGMKAVLVGSQTGNREDYELLRELCDEGTILVDDTNPLELSRFIQEKQVDLFIGGVKERPIAFKLGIGFCDHNHERKEALAGFQGMVNFAGEVYRSVMSPVWKLVPRVGHGPEITPSPRYSGERAGVRGERASADVILRPVPGRAFPSDIPAASGTSAGNPGLPVADRPCTGTCETCHACEGQS